MAAHLRVNFRNWLLLALLLSGLGLTRPAHSQVTFSVPPAWNGSSFVADFNKDGFADYIAPSGFVYLGNGDGTFRQGKQVPGAASALGDVNGDGNVDILQRDFGGPLNGVLYVALGNGDGTFQPRITNYTLPMLSILAADLNGDGKADVVGVESPNLNMLFIYLGKGDGTFVAGQTLPLNGSLVALADFNGDKIPDILIAESNGVTVLLGNGDGTFQAGKFTQSVSITSPVITGDFNNDGKLDLVIANELLFGEWRRYVPTASGNRGAAGRMGLLKLREISTAMAISIWFFRHTQPWTSVSGTATARFPLTTLTSKMLTIRMLTTRNRRSLSQISMETASLMLLETDSFSSAMATGPFKVCLLSLKDRPQRSGASTRKETGRRMSSRSPRMVPTSSMC